MSNEQEQFWAGDFGNQYHQRNAGRVKNNVNFFSEIFTKIIDRGPMPRSVVELGAGIGENLLAIHRVWSGGILVGVDINEAAVKEMAKHKEIEAVFWGAIGAYRGLKAELVMTKGCLIHIAPENLPAAYETLYHNTNKYILICEYYNSTPVEVPYRGHAGKLFKRDFAGEMMDTYKDLKLVDYGFRYHRDEYPQDDISWFLMEKRP